MFGLFSNIKAMVIGGGMLLALSVGAYLYVTNLQDKLELERTHRIQAEQAAEKNQEVIRKLQNQKTLDEENRRQLETETRQIRQRNSELRRILAEHDLTYLAEEKPGLIEKRINDGTQEVLDAITTFTLDAADGMQ